MNMCVCYIFYIFIFLLQVYRKIVKVSSSDIFGCLLLNSKRNYQEKLIKIIKLHYRLRTRIIDRFLTPAGVNG